MSSNSISASIGIYGPRLLAVIFLIPVSVYLLKSIFAPINWPNESKIRERSHKSSDKRAAMSMLAKGNRNRVILVTLDGVRPQEFFGKADGTLLKHSRTAQNASSRDVYIFQNLRKRIAREGVVYGAPTSRAKMIVGNAAMISLPAYASLLSGFPVFCLTNHCGRTGRDSILDRLRKIDTKGGIKAAVFASWDRIRYSSRRLPGTEVVNAGLQSFITPSRLHRDINNMQKKNIPLRWGSARYDRYTFAHAMRYLERERPSFLYISLNDADEWAHLNRYDKYIHTLRRYDVYMEILFRTAEKLPGRTYFFILTDHGRGQGDDFIGHGYRMQSIPIWLYIRGPGIVHTRDPSGLEGRTLFSHLDVAPTIEALLGLSPRGTPGPGMILKSVLKAFAVKKPAARKSNDL